MSGADLVATSLISLAEAAAALAATPRWSGPPRAELKRRLAAPEGDWADYVVVAADERLAAQVAWRRSVSATQALHIAAALTVGGLAAPQKLLFASLDTALLRAARAEGLDVTETRLRRG